MLGATGRQEGTRFPLNFLSFSFSLSHFLVVLLFHFLSPLRYFLRVFAPILYFTNITRIVYSVSCFLLATHTGSLSLCLTHTHTHTHTMLMNLCQEKVGARPAHCPSPPQGRVGGQGARHPGRPRPSLLACLPCPVPLHLTPFITLYITQSFQFPRTRLPKYHLQKVTLAVIILFVSLCKKKKKKKMKKGGSIKDSIKGKKKKKKEKMYKN